MFLVPKCCNNNVLKIVENWTRNGNWTLTGQRCDNEVLKNTISLQKLSKMGSVSSSLCTFKACKVQDTDSIENIGDM